jgi:hypothetical protein
MNIRYIKKRENWGGGMATLPPLSVRPWSELEQRSTYVGAEQKI